MARGKLILIFGPSGSGKNVLTGHAKEVFPGLVFPLSYTTRERRPTDENNSYRFVTKEAFEEKRARGEFLEWAQFGDNFYGTDRAEIEQAILEGKVLFKEMEVQGIEQVMSAFPHADVVHMFVDAGSWEALERRVRARAPISEEELEKRRHRYEEEMKFVAQIGTDYTIKNADGELDAAKAALETAIREVLENTVG